MSHSTIAHRRGALGLPEVRLNSGGSTSSLGLPSSAAPAARGLTFATINAETLETAARDADFPVPAEDVIDKVTLMPLHCHAHCVSFRMMQILRVHVQWWLPT